MFFDRFSLLCSENSVSKSKAVESVGLNRTVIVKWKNGSIPTGSTISKLAEYFHVSTDYLLGNTDERNVSREKEAPVLTKKDERDIAKKMEEMLGLLSSSDPLMFDGEPLDDETKELLRASYENQLRMTKQIAKAKYTPKKYKK